MITPTTLSRIIVRLGDQAADDIRWAESLTEPNDPDAFALEVIFVICNSGMKNTVARQIFDRCQAALKESRPVISVFGHRGKAAAIEQVWRDRAELLAGYLASSDKLAFCESLPWIGAITKYHLAKNFGFDVAKPDVHLARLAKLDGCSVQQLCERIARETGYRVATVDTVLWRACAMGVLDSHTGKIKEAA